MSSRFCCANCGKLQPHDSGTSSEGEKLNRRASALAAIDAVAGSICGLVDPAVHLHWQDTADQRQEPGVPGGVADDIRLGLDDAAAGDAFGHLPHQNLADEKASE
jgi:hypothetical protein